MAVTEGLFATEHTEVAGKKPLLGVDPQVNIHVRPAIELTYSLGVAFTTVVLRVQLIVGIQGKRREAVLAVFAHDVGLDRTGAGVGQVYDRAGQGSILVIDDAARQQSS